MLDRKEALQGKVWGSKTIPFYVIPLMGKGSIMITTSTMVCRERRSRLSEREAINDADTGRHMFVQCVELLKVDYPQFPAVIIPTFSPTLTRVSHGCSPVDARTISSSKTAQPLG